MERKNSRKSLRKIYIAATSNFGNQTSQMQGLQSSDLDAAQSGVLHLREKTDKSIDSAMKRDGRFSYQLTFYQGIVGAMNSKKIFDILILFVRKEDADGLKTEEMLWLKNTSARVICVSEGTGFLKDAFRIGVFRYVLRENMGRDLTEAIGEVLQEIEPVQGIRLTIDGEDKWVPFEDIYYIEAFGDEAIIYKKDTYSTVRKTMDYLLEQLGNAFYRCHKSYIVNFAYVQRIDDDSVILKDARSVPVSVRRRGGLVKIYHNYEEGKRGKNNIL